MKIFLWNDRKRGPLFLAVPASYIPAQKESLPSVAFLFCFEDGAACGVDFVIILIAA